MTQAVKKRDYSKRTSFKLLTSLLAPYKGLAALVLLFLLCDICGMLFVPTELSSLINTAVSASNINELWIHVLRMLIASIVGSGGCVISYLLASRLAAYVGRDLRIAVYKKSLELSGSDFEHFGTGSMITRTNSDANIVQQSLLMSFVMMFPVPVVCVVSICLAWSIDALMGKVLLLLSLVLVVILVLAVAKSAPIFMRLQAYIDRMNVRLRETITGVRVIRAFGKESRERAKLNATFEEYAKNAIRVNLIFSIADCTTFFLMNAVEALFMYLGANRVGVHAIQIGSISALIEYAMFILFFMMMAQFALLQLPRAFACLTRAAEVLDWTPSIADPSQKEMQSAKVAKTQEDPVVRFDKVSFRFDDADEDTLNDVSFDLRRGGVTAVIGNTGSGKSTITKLLLRFHEVSQGAIYLGTSDIRQVTQQDLRSHLAYVPQRAWLFSGTIAANLREGAPNASDERLWHALQVAQADFVKELPDGLNSKVAQGGSNFSGGQRQRLAIARALVRQADVYVFDDSFSALDYKTDAALRAALKEELAQAAQLVIAQRISSIKDADQIIVLKDGLVVGQGTHEELMQSCASYQDIAESQAKGANNQTEEQHSTEGRQ